MTTTDLRDQIARAVSDAQSVPFPGRKQQKIADAVLAVVAPLIAREKAEAQALLDATPRFWPKVNVGSASECWTWRANTDPRGYGRFSFGGRNSVLAHRIAWAIANGRMPRDESYICHRCDNPPCVNPAHLFEGTPKDNHSDMVRKGRTNFQDGYCRKGHELSPDNTIFRPNGDRRCKNCTRESQRQHRKNAPRFACWECGKTLGIYNLQRHVRDQHDQDMDLDELRAKYADGIEQEADRV